MTLSVASPAARRGPALAAGLGLAAALVWSPSAALADEALADMVERVSPAVVTVLADELPDERSGRRGMPDPFERFGRSPFEKFFREFGPDGNPFGGERRRQGLGSGFVLDPDGLIVTNHHVVEDADEVTVRFSGLGDFVAEVVGTDPQSDLALLRIEADEALPFVKLGDSDAVRVGEDVFAVGNPFGLGGTVTKGIVSATQRDIRRGPYVDFIQTDAAINRGNSGGPLFNMKGEVIGVNSAILSPNGGSVGVGFAVAANIVRDVIADLKSDGVVDRGWLGVQIQRVTPEIAEAMGLERPMGALVANVLPDAPSEGALETGDVILSFGGEAVQTSRDLPKLVGRTEPGTAVEIEVLRDGDRRSVSVTIGAFADDRQAAVSKGRSDRGGRLASEALGATLARLTPDARENIGLGDGVDGVVVTSIQPRGAAARSGLQVGDVILEVDRRPVSSPRELDDALDEGKTDTRLLLVNRRGSQLYLGLRLS
ncbi:DegQ family serine endoprotease [Paralimibaculum aggregatum]|uniref:Probable periplasmic serine endoprotease DegP-like n=1 Tax=Paralimibaculum aggregatum TaxID=3036245 RepID=A0ABQ6LHK9_9RHOB|nr:Do family serine endopeptidase [Limibaculum sp. NKW23]GMG81710.1 DegQ family serine endoprotease [Limibaculum sp. NKW23]